MTKRQWLSILALGMVSFAGYYGAERATPVPQMAGVVHGMASETSVPSPAPTQVVETTPITPIGTPTTPPGTAIPTVDATVTAQPAALVETTDAPAVPAPTESAYTDSPTLFSIFMAPVDRSAKEKRQWRRAKDPQKYDQQVDLDLARLGTTFLLVVCGIDHEPPLVERVLVCSNSLFLIRRDGTIDTITFTHDTRFPEQEREEEVLGKEGSARRSDAIWLRRKNNDSGLRVLREAYRAATGLPIDFILIVQSDTAIQQLIDRVFGKLRVDVPIGFTAQPIYLDEKTKLPLVAFPAGVQEMDGTAVLQYMKAVPLAESFPPQLENNERKHIVFRAILNAVDSNKFNPLFWPTFLMNLHDFVQLQLQSENIVSSFDVRELITDNLSAAGEQTAKLIFERKSIHPGIPRFGKARYYVDPHLGVYEQSPIQWGTRESGDLFAKRDIEDLKIYDDYYVEVPKNGDALEPDLVSGYWKPVRQDVHGFLLGVEATE